MSLKQIGFGTVTRRLRRRVQLPGGDGRNFTTEPAGSEIGSVEILVDIDLLLDRIGERALSNKSGETRLQGGSVIVRMLDRRKGP